MSEIAARPLAFNDADQLPPATQKLLLAIAEGRESWLLGNADRSVRSNLRLLFVTHEPLADLVNRGDVRSDLAFRLEDGVTVALRPLREHLEDVPALAASLLARLGTELAIEPLRLSAEATEVLSRYHYPGKVRELGSVLRRAIYGLLRRGETPDVLLPRHLDVRESPPAHQTKRRVMRKDVTAEMIQRASAEAKSADQAASLLGLRTRSLYRRMAELGLRRS